MGIMRSCGSPWSWPWFLNMGSKLNQLLFLIVSVTSALGVHYKPIRDPFQLALVRGMRRFQQQGRRKKQQWKKVLKEREREAGQPGWETLSTGVLIKKCKILRQNSPGRRPDVWTTGLSVIHQNSQMAGLPLLKKKKIGLYLSQFLSLVPLQTFSASCGLLKNRKLLFVREVSFNLTSIMTFILHHENIHV